MILCRSLCPRPWTCLGEELRLEAIRQVCLLSPLIHTLDGSHGNSGPPERLHHAPRSPSWEIWYWGLPDSRRKQNSLNVFFFGCRTLSFHLPQGKSSSFEGTLDFLPQLSDSQSIVCTSISGHGYQALEPRPRTAPAEQVKRQDGSLLRCSPRPHRRALSRQVELEPG